MSTIAVLPGDGIGPEVTAAAVAVLRAVRPDLAFVECLVGGAALRAGDAPLPAQTRTACDASDAILFGAVGGFEFNDNPSEMRPEWALLQLRRIYDLFANLRPVRVFPGLEDASTLQASVVAGLDLVVLRELTSGIYYGKKDLTVVAGERIASDLMVYRDSEIARILRVGFALARARRKELCSVDKQNVLETSRLWRTVALEIAPEYPDVKLTHMLVDNAAMQLLRDPRQFDVMVMENMFGDILSDEAAMLTGSLGNLPSASLGKKTEHGTFGMYEPISGTAPDIAGKGIANPTAAILSAALLLRYSLGDTANAERIEAAVSTALAQGARTADLARNGATPLSTTAFTERITAEL